MSLPLVIGGLLALAAILSSARLVYGQLRADTAQRSRGWRMVLLLLGQPLCALLLYFSLFPPAVPIQARTMVVATAGATLAQLNARVAGAALVALPEAPPLDDAQRVPDLATALRRHPEVRRIRVVGAGLEARDRDAVRGLAVEFQPVPLPRGMVELTAPQRIAAGNRFHIGGRAAAMPDGVVELVDPGGRRVDQMTLPADGRFVLDATTRVPGLAIFTLSLRDARRRLVERLDVPLQVVADAPPRVLVLAGAPNPELKYLRRWAADAGLSMHTQVGVGGGLLLGDAPIALNAASLAKFDIVVLDDRAWALLGPGARGALLEAARGGLGVLLRVSGALSGDSRAQLRALGFAVKGDGHAAPVRLAPASTEPDILRARMGPGTRDAPTTDILVSAPELTRPKLQISAADASPLLRDAAGFPVALWRAEGRGRIGLWTLADSYRLILTGRGDLHGELWSAAIAMLARTQAGRPPVIEAGARQGERMVFCDLAAGARVIAADGKSVVLLPDPSSGTPPCAAFWPLASGWHVLRQGETNWPFHVRARVAGAGLQANAMREATLRLAATPVTASPSSPAAAGWRTGPRWPWLIAWFMATAGLWWLERARAGRALRS